MGKEKASVSMEAQLEKISATIESLSKEVANLSASLRQEKEKIKVEVESSLHALNVVMKAIYMQLGLLFFFFFVATFVFASIVFVIEKNEEDTSFQNMYEAIWWAIIPMTTVGYGDISPVTGLGKVVGGLCAVSGVLFISLPLPIITINLANFYLLQMRKSKNFLAE